MNEQINPQDLTLSTDIDRMISARNEVLSKMEQALELIKGADALAEQSGFKRDTAYYSFMGHDDTFSCYNRDHLLPKWKRKLDALGWHGLLNKSGMKVYMDSKAIDDFSRTLEKEPPELNMDNIQATFESLVSSKQEIFERGVLNVFKALSWNYKTNKPNRFGKKIIKGYGSESNWSSGRRISHQSEAAFNDLDKVLHTLDNKPVPEHRHSFSIKANDWMKGQGGDQYQGDYLNVKLYKKGSIHITFNRPDLVEEMNKILAKHYPGALSERV